jgi:hypothetical protein
VPRVTPEGVIAKRSSSLSFPFYKAEHTRNIRMRGICIIMEVPQVPIFTRVELSNYQIFKNIKLPGALHSPIPSSLSFFFLWSSNLIRQDHRPIPSQTTTQDEINSSDPSFHGNPPRLRRSHLRRSRRNPQQPRPQPLKASILPLDIQLLHGA